MFYMMCSVFFFKQKTAYEMRISDWSSDVCSSDLLRTALQRDCEGRFGQIVFRGDRLEHIVGQPAFKRHDSGRIAAKALLRKGIHLNEGNCVHIICSGLFRASA